MHTIKLPLKTTSYDDYMIDKRFHAVSHIHNVLVKHAQKLLIQLQHDKPYQDLRSEYCTLIQKTVLTDDEESRRKFLSSEMNTIREKIGLTDAALQSYIKVCGAMYSHLLSSQQVQKEAKRVWEGVESILFRDGKGLHFKPYAKFHTISGKCATNGVKFDPYAMQIKWIGLEIKCRPPRKQKDLQYLKESLDHKIKYCELERKMFPNGWHYYVIIYLDGPAPKKLLRTGTGTMGLDPGISSIAGCSGSSVFLRELAPRCKEYDCKINELLNKLDRSRRTMNPEKFNQDGTINRSNKDKWKISHSYHKNMNRLLCLYRQKSEYTKQSHERLCNELLQDSVNFIAEAMTFKALQHRSKKTEQDGNTTTVHNKDGSTQTVRKCKRKKRFGRSINDRSPALFISILQRKSLQYGGSFITVSTQSFKASQYDHETDSYQKVPLSQRTKQIGLNTVQRDLYSAYLIRNTNETLDHPDRQKCLDGFKGFLSMQDRLISDMKRNNVTMKQCFGF